MRARRIVGHELECGKKKRGKWGEDGRRRRNPTLLILRKEVGWCKKRQCNWSRERWVGEGKNIMREDGQIYRTAQQASMIIVCSQCLKLCSCGFCMETSDGVFLSFHLHLHRSGGWALCDKDSYNCHRTWITLRRPSQTTSGRNNGSPLMLSAVLSGRRWHGETDSESQWKEIRVFSVSVAQCRGWSSLKWLACRLLMYSHFNCQHQEGDGRRVIFGVIIHWSLKSQSVASISDKILKCSQ